jgi:hypothetical protein
MKNNSGPRRRGKGDRPRVPRGEVTVTVNSAPAFASAREAAEVVRAGLGFLAAADATQLAAETQAECLQILEQVTAMGTAARTSILAAFTSGQGYSADADYSPRAWLVNRTRVTKAAAVGYTAWVRRAAGHPQVAQVLAAGEMSESYARAICGWTDKLPGGLPGGWRCDPGRGGGGGDGPAGPDRAGRGDLRPVPARCPGPR